MPSPLVFLKNGIGTTVFAIVPILPPPKRYYASAHNVSGMAVFSMDAKPHFSFMRRERVVFCSPQESENRRQLTKVFLTQLCTASVSVLEE